jgi:hypothetical protein
MTHRGVRRKQDLAFKISIDYENLLPHRRECAWNNTYSWGCDGCITADSDGS